MCPHMTCTWFVKLAFDSRKRSLTLVKLQRELRDRKKEACIIVGGYIGLAGGSYSATLKSEAQDLCYFCGVLWCTSSYTWVSVAAPTSPTFPFFPTIISSSLVHALSVGIYFKFCQNFELISSLSRFSSPWWVGWVVFGCDQCDITLYYSLTHTWMELMTV